MIRVLIVDDSAVMRKVLSESLSSCRDIEVVATAVDPFVARDKIVKLKPDVITLDLEMPRMHGLSFLAKLMKHHPMPVVVVSSLTPKNSDMALSALRNGAAEVICKPSNPGDTSSIGPRLAYAIRAAASAKVMEPVQKDKREGKATAPIRTRVPRKCSRNIIALGASTGGTVALERVLRDIPKSSPGIVIVQHMPEYFTATFAQRLDTTVTIDVREAEDGDRIENGLALVAPGNYHMLLKRDSKGYFVKIKDGPPVHFQRPSVDVLFESVAGTAGKDAACAILTGMGSDGAAGLLTVRENGGYTVAQNEETSVIFGMPREAIRKGAVDSVLPLEEIASGLLDAVSGKENNNKDKT